MAMEERLSRPGTGPVTPQTRDRRGLSVRDFRLYVVQVGADRMVGHVLGPRCFPKVEEGSAGGLGLGKVQIGRAVLEHDFGAEMEKWSFVQDGKDLKRRKLWHRVAIVDETQQRHALVLRDALLIRDLWLAEGEGLTQRDTILLEQQKHDHGGSRAQAVSGDACFIAWFE